MRKGIAAIKDAIWQATPYWERNWDEYDYAGLDYEDYEDSFENIAGAEPGQRYG